MIKEYPSREICLGKFRFKVRILNIKALNSKQCSLNFSHRNDFKKDQMTENIGINLNSVVKLRSDK